mgnify:CR=1 FL=1
MLVAFLQRGPLWTQGKIWDRCLAHGCREEYHAVCCPGSPGAISVAEEAAGVDVRHALRELPPVEDQQNEAQSDVGLPPKSGSDPVRV